MSDLTATQLQAIFHRALCIGSGLKRYAFLKAFLIKTVAFLHDNEGSLDIHDERHGWNLYYGEEN